MTMTMTTKTDFGEIFRKAWDMKYRDEFVYLGSHTVPGIEIRRFASAFAGSTQWKCVDEDATDDKLFLLGLDIARFLYRGNTTGELFSLLMGRFRRAELVDMGRLAYNAVYGPKNPVIQALFRRYKE